MKKHLSSIPAGIIYIALTLLILWLMAGCNYADKNKLKPDAPADKFANKIRAIKLRDSIFDASMAAISAENKRQLKETERQLKEAKRLNNSYKP